MAQVDIAGTILPNRYGHGRMTAVAVNEFIFKQPVRVGDLLSFYSRVECIGTTSITVLVEVFTEGFTDQCRSVKVAEAQLTYVAIDFEGRPRALPRPLACEQQSG